MSNGRAGVLYLIMGIVENFERTYEFEGLVRFIEIPVTLKRQDGNISVSRTFRALIDTGAELSAIKADVAEEFGFDFVRETTVNTASKENEPVTIYSGEVWLDNYIMSIPEIAELTNKNNRHDFVIGMNILRHSDFAITNANGKTVFTIRFPPREKIDFMI